MDGDAPSDRCAVEALGALDDVLRPDFDELAFYEASLRRLARRKDVRGVLGTDDFPASLLAAMLAAKLHLPGPPLAAVLHCQHKAASRRAQRAVVPEAVPRFATIDVPQHDVRVRAPLDFPFFVKPVKSFASVLARQIDDEESFATLIRDARAELPAIARGFDALVARTGLPSPLRALTSNALIAEEVLQGSQVTVDGFTCAGEVTILGIVDSHFVPGTRSFERFESPSALPTDVQRRMASLVRRCMESIGLERVVFNVELIWNPRVDRIAIVEINGRMASQFVSIYRSVRGIDLYRLQVDLALGATPRVPAFHPDASSTTGFAASFVLRSRTDGVVSRVPTPAEVERLRERWPSLRVESLVRVGDRLSDHFQDGETHRYAIVDLAAATRSILHANWEAVRARLPFVVEVSAPAAVDSLPVVHSAPAMKRSVRPTHAEIPFAHDSSETA